MSPCVIKGVSGGAGGGAGAGGGRDGGAAAVGGAGGTGGGCHRGVVVGAAAACGWDGAVVDLDGGLFRGVSGGWLRGAGVATGAAQLRELD